MSNENRTDDHAPQELVLRHERELSYLATVTKELSKKQDIVLEGLEELKGLSVDIRIIKEGMIDKLTLREKLQEVNLTMKDIKTTVDDLKTELGHKETRLKELEDSTSHLGWLNKSIKTVVEKAGTILVVGILTLIATHWETIQKALDIIK